MSHGKLPLPAEIQVKHDPKSSDFWHLPARSSWVQLAQQDIFGDKNFKFERKVYKDDIQKSFWSCLHNCAIKTFALMEYKMQPALGKEKLEFPKQNEAMIDQVISIVDGSTREELKKLMAHITLGHIAQLVLDMIHSFWANKNWNSHGNAVCAAMCNIAILVSTLKDKTTLPVNFI